MPDGRFLSKSVSLSEQLASVSLEAALLFTWCIPHLDSEGRLLGNAASVKATAVPLRDEIPLDSVPSLLLELARAPKDEHGRPLVYWYEVQSRRYLEFPGFVSHQRGLRKDREAKSRLPSRKHPQATDLSGGGNDTPDQLRTGAGPAPAELPLSEVKEYVSTEKISNENHGSRSSGSAPEGAPPGNSALSGQQLHEAKERVKAGLRELAAETPS